MRLNSWDALQNPSLLGTEMLEQMRGSGTRPIVFIGLYALLLVFTYLLLYVFGNLWQEDAGKP